MTFDPSDDWSGVIDGLQAITLLRPGTSVSVPVLHALRRGVKDGRAESVVAWNSQNDVVWHLPAAEIPQSPRPGDLLIEEDGRRWTVLSVRAVGLATRWRCIARDLIAAHGLGDCIRIERANYVKSSNGAEEVVWRLWKTGVRARIQPLIQEKLDEHHRTTTAAVFKIYVAEDLEMDHACRIRGPDGKAYRVQSYSAAQRLDAVGEIMAIADEDGRRDQG